MCRITGRWSSFLQSRKAFRVPIPLLSAFDTALSSLLFHSQRTRHSGRPAASAVTLDESHRVETGRSRPRLVGSRRIASDSVTQRSDWWYSGLRTQARILDSSLRVQRELGVSPPLYPITPQEGATPFSTIAMDWITKLPPSLGYDSILTITDHDCSKAVLFFPCKETMGTKELA